MDHLTTRRKALITGVTGQDGSYLAELLLGKGYEVHGLVRRHSTPGATRNIDHLLPQLQLHSGDLTDATTVTGLLYRHQFEEVYNLAAQSHVAESFFCPEYTFEATGTVPMRMLQAIHRFSPHTRFYQASSSEMFGKVQETPQREQTPFWPRSPYACAKVAAYWSVVNCRESYGTHASNGILFNHESPRRGETFVTRKITLAAARIKRGLQRELRLGNLDAKRDWGFAKEYVEAMWLMLQQPEGDDYVVATGETHSIRECLDVAFSELGLDWRDYVVQAPEFYRPAEVDLLLGNPAKARTKLGWKPKTTFEELIRLMVRHDYDKSC